MTAGNERGPDPPDESVERQQDKEVFSAVLRELRKRQGISQSRLAVLASLDHSSISYFESGSRKPSREVVNLLIGSLGLNEIDGDRLRASAGFSGEGNTIAHTELGVLAVNAVLKDPEVSQGLKDNLRGLIIGALDEVGMEDLLLPETEL